MNCCFNQGQGEAIDPHVVGSLTAVIRGYISRPSEHAGNPETRLLLKLVKRAIRFRELDDEEIREVKNLVMCTFEADSKADQLKAFKLLKKLINEKTTELTAGNARIFEALFEMYFTSIFQTTRHHDIITEAAEHAITFLVPRTHAFNGFALDAFDLDHLAMCPIEDWPKNNVKNLLTIAVEKIHHRLPDGEQLDQFVGFLAVLCGREEESCTLIAGISEVVAELYDVFRQGGRTDLYTRLDRPSLFSKILYHVADTSDSQCWLAVAKLIECLFRCNDPSTNRILERAMVVPAMIKMFERSGGKHGPEVVSPLLQAVQNTCRGVKNGLEIDANWIIRVIPFVLQNVAATTPPLRSRAYATFISFYELAELHHMLNNNLLGALVDLLKSRQTNVLLDALKWLFSTIQGIELAPQDWMFNRLNETRARSRLEALRNAECAIVRRAALLTLERLVPPNERGPLRDTREEVREFFENLPHRE